MILHASCVAVGGVGLLLTGPSGAGKSDLALRLLDQGAQLVADDQTHLARDADRILASAPPRLRGWIEVRGMGLIERPSLDRISVGGVIELRPGGAVERLPEHAPYDLLGLPLAWMAMDGFSPSACARARLFAVLISEGRWPPDHARLNP